MRETKFIEQNRDKWLKFEKILQDNKKDPEELSSLFMEVTDDLSYSRTFYPNRSVRVYLNNLAQRTFYSIYRNRKSRLKKFWQFWKDDVPQMLFESRFDLLLSFLVFMLSVSIGVFSSMMDPEFCRVVLGDGYVDMTLENIKEGKPMSVYQDPDQGSMFMQITINNLRVAFITFILGILFGGGTIFILIVNGIMVGTFQYLFFQQGVYADSILTIWLHGAIEISSIVIAGAAGIHLGRGMLFPGTYTRLQGLQLSARRALLIYLTIVPLIIMAGFIESYITRYSDASYVVRAVFIIVSFAFMIGYFVFYPWLKARRGFTASIREVDIPSVKKTMIDFKSIKNSGQIFSDSFALFRRNVSRYAILAGIISLIYCSFQSFFEKELYFVQNRGLLGFIVSCFTAAENTLALLYPGKFGLQWILNILALSASAYITFLGLSRKANKIPLKIGYYVNTIIATLLICSLMILLLNMPLSGFYMLLCIVFVFPILMLCLATVFNESTNVLDGIGKSFNLQGSSWSEMMGSYLVISLLCYIFLFITTSPILSLLIEMSASFLPFKNSEFIQFRELFLLFMQSFALFFLFPILFTAISVGQFSFRETSEASDLNERLQKFGETKRSFGMQKEEAQE
jgi:uncharacterized membrane protein SpoIIM required for sporulation